ncbi:hypothetical protein JKP88DRAFT_336986 [Tribonema minus]|uniref:Uncharacterized protein n=1 Tax=Tribonema minus TaxID=303371 RepID=A0A835YRP9_9STRA|nr:hypothetical protein JKP88DRAFT_336986 [Tribonema minus]
MRDQLAELKAGGLGGCQLVCRALQRHMKSSRVQAWGLSAVMALALSQQNAVRLGRAGACARAVEALRRHAQCASVQAWACAAIAYLITECKDNHNALRAAGACALVAAALTTHTRDNVVQSNALFAASRLAADPDDSAQLGNDGVCEHALRAMTAAAPPASAALLPYPVPFSALMAVANLAELAANGARISGAGGCAALLAAVRACPRDAAVQRWAWLGISRLAKDPETAMRLGDAGAWLLAVTAYRTARDNAAAATAAPAAAAAAAVAAAAAAPDNIPVQDASALPVLRGAIYCLAQHPANRAMLPAGGVELLTEALLAHADAERNAQQQTLEDAQRQLAQERERSAAAQLALETERQQRATDAANAAAAQQEEAAREEARRAAAAAQAAALAAAQAAALAAARQKVVQEREEAAAQLLQSNNARAAAQRTLAKLQAKLKRVREVLGSDDAGSAAPQQRSAHVAAAAATGDENGHKQKKQRAG